MAITLNGTTGITTPDITSDGSLKIDASAPDDSLVVDASGNVGIRTSSPSSRLTVSNGAITAGAGGDVFIGRYSSSFPSPGAGYFRLRTNNVDGDNGGISIDTLSSGVLSERMRIDSSGNLLVGKTSNGSSGQGSVLFQNAAWQSSVNGTAFAYHALFYRNADSTPTVIGAIASSGSTTTYATSSDYRLKENVVGVTGASARVQQLNPVRFNFIADPDTTVDGFLAHEVQDVVPEAITGTKDAVDAEGNPEYQGIDQSKLVPLLTAALQEALAKIETLEARVAALEAA